MACPTGCIWDAQVGLIVRTGDAIMLLDPDTNPKGPGYSRPLDVHKMSEAPEAKVIVDKLLPEVIPSEVEGKVRKRYREALKMIVLNLYLAWKDDPKLWVAYQRNKSAYTVGKRYQKFFLKYTQTIGTVDGLIRYGYIENKMGFHNPQTGFGRVSRMRATAKLWALFIQTPIPKKRMKSQAPEIVLKDHEKKVIDFAETPKVRKWRNNVKKINKILEGADIDLNLTDEQRIALVGEMGYPVDTTKRSITRSFCRKSFDDGGRFYRIWVHELPREYRKYVTIDGEATVELDFSGYHTRMLYQMMSPTIPEGDVYAVEGVDPAMRELLKTGLNIMLNAKSWKNAIGAIHTNKKIRPMELKREEIEEIMRRFLEKHWRIAPAFNSDVGVILQFMDSCVAEKILLRLAAMGIATVPVHDSFICQARYEEELRFVMQDEYETMFGTGIPIGKKS